MEDKNRIVFMKDKNHVSHNRNNLESNHRQRLQNSRAVSFCIEQKLVSPLHFSIIEARQSSHPDLCNSIHKPKDT